GVLVLLDRRRRIAVDLRAVSTRPGVHRRPGAWAPGLRAQSVFHHRQWTAIIGERLSARELSAPSMSNRSDDTFACPGGRGEGSGAIGLAAKVDVSNRRFQCSPLFGRQAECELAECGLSRRDRKPVI